MSPSDTHRSPVISSYRPSFSQDEPPILDTDRAALRQALVPAIISLSGVSDKAVRAQVAETISLVAKCNFPEQWPDLVDVSTAYSPLSRVA